MPHPPSTIRPSSHVSPSVPADEVSEDNNPDKSKQTETKAPLDDEKDQPPVKDDDVVDVVPTSASPGPTPAGNEEEVVETKEVGAALNSEPAAVPDVVTDTGDEEVAVVPVVELDEAAAENGE